MSGRGRIPEPTGRACQHNPARGECEDCIFNVRSNDIRGQPPCQLDRFIETHHDVAGVKGGTGNGGIDPAQERDQLIAG